MKKRVSLFRFRNKLGAALSFFFFPFAITQLLLSFFRHPALSTFKNHLFTLLLTCAELIFVLGSQREYTHGCLLPLSSPSQSAEEFPPSPPLFVPTISSSHHFLPRSSRTGLEPKSSSHSVNAAGVEGTVSCGTCGVGGEEAAAAEIAAVAVVVDDVDGLSAMSTLAASSSAALRLEDDERDRRAEKKLDTR